jgi:hypothetical protein
MFNLVLAMLTVLPFIGLVLMEQGAYGPDIYDFGHSNGASIAYGVHFTVMLTAYAAGFLLLRMTILPSGRYAAPVDPPIVYDVRAYRRLARLALLINLLALAFVFFISGASNVVFGVMDKGMFRTQARFGMVAFLCRDFISPMLSALVAYVYMRTTPRRTEMLLLGANLVVTAAAGAIWGYRAAVLMMLLPPAFMLVRRMTLTRAAGLVAGGLALVVFASTFYEGYPVGTAINGAWTRATLGTANSAWRVWDIETTAPALIPPYAPTLRAAFGNRLGRLLGADLDGPLDVSRPRDYSTLATLVAKNFSQGVDATSSVTTGVFGEAVVALGSRWFVLMSLAAGLLIAVVRAVFEYGQHHYRPLAAIMAANYFMASVFSWLNSGGVTVLFLVPLLVNYTITYTLARTLLQRAGVPHAQWRWLRPWTTSAGFDARVVQS